MYLRLTDNWLELATRFITREYNIRDIKDAISREVIEGFDKAGNTIASSTIEIVNFPKLDVAVEGK
ncbi:MAG: hypothetical protein GF401_08945 [Chitinivibrionales bacterium]|nr:hypothetical protein [Chitinivibrionales bacterium]